MPKKAKKKERAYKHLQIVKQPQPLSNELDGFESDENLNEDLDEEFDEEEVVPEVLSRTDYPRSLPQLEDPEVFEKEFFASKKVKANYKRLLELLEERPELGLLRLSPEDLAIGLFEFIERHPNVSTIPRSQEELERWGQRMENEILPELLTPDFVSRATAYLESALVHCQDNPKDSRALIQGLLFIESHHEGYPPDENPLWGALFSMAMSELMDISERLED